MFMNTHKHMISSEVNIIFNSTAYNVLNYYALKVLYIRNHQKYSLKHL